MRLILLRTPSTASDHPAMPGVPVPYADLILARVLGTPAQGATIEQIEHALAVSAAVKDAVRAGQGDVLLDEAAWSYLVSRISEGGWALIDPLIPAFVRDVKGAALVDGRKAA